MTYDSFMDLSKSYPVVPVYKIYEEDLLTPIGIYNKLKAYDPSFILESVGDPKNLGRYSFIGLESDLLTTPDNTMSLSEVETIISNYNGPEIKELPPYYASVIGYMAYNAVEDIHPVTLRHKSTLATYQFMFSKTVVAFDHLTQQLIIIANVVNPTPEDYARSMTKIESIYKTLQMNNMDTTPAIGDTTPITFTSSFKKKDYFKAVEKVKDYILAGDVFQVVLSQKFTAKVSIDGFDLYRNLRKVNPAPYLSYIRFPDVEILCSSPEMLVRMNSELVETAPIAGTRAVKSDGKDHLREAELIKDEKDLAEHLMLVDLGRNDIGRISKAGTVTVPEYCQAKYFSKVMHLVSSVKGIPLETVTPIDSLRATFPAGTVSGAPKIRALEIIDEIEPTSRELYAGSVVMLNQSGHLNSCISIRTIQLKKEEITIQAGGGIVYDSTPEHEYLECLNKASALFEAVEKTYKGEINYDFDYR